MAEKIMNEHIKYMNKEFGARPFIVGGGFDKTVNKITLKFKITGPMSIKRARRLVLASSQDLLDRVNNSEEIRPYLLNYPFLPKNLSYGLTSVNEEGRMIKNSGSSRDPENLASCSMLGGKILYSILNEDKISLQVIHRETYEEALEIVNSEGGIFQND